MSNSTAEYWEVDGVSLHQYAWSVETIGGSRWSLPPVRGTNIQYSYLPGKAYLPKVPDERTILLRMWMIGIDPDTDGWSVDQRVQWNENWRRLQRLFFHPERQLVLTRRWQEKSGMRSASAKAELVGTMEPVMTGRTRATFEVELLLADPFFYGPVQTVELARDVPVVVNYGGDYPSMTAEGVQVTFRGALSNPRLTNALPDPDVWFQVATDVAAGDSVVVDVQRTTARRASDSASVLGGVTHSGSRRFMVLHPGANSLTLSASSGAGTASLTYREVFV